MTAYVKRASVPPHLVDDRDPPAIALLKEDHQVLRALFDLVETVGDEVLFPVAGDICIRLAIHMAVEEHLLYPALKPVIGVREIDEGIVEHQVTKRLISDIMEMTGREEIFRARSTSWARRRSITSMRKTASFSHMPERPGRRGRSIWSSSGPK